MAAILPLQEELDQFPSRQHEVLSHLCHGSAAQRSTFLALNDYGGRGDELFGGIANLQLRENCCILA